MRIRPASSTILRSRGLLLDMASLWKNDDVIERRSTVKTNTRPTWNDMNEHTASESWRTRKFSEAAYYAAYKTVRNKIRQFDPISLTETALNYLHAPFKADIDYLQRKPWLVLLIVKWALIDEQAPVKGRPKPSERQLCDITAAADSAGDRTRLPNEFDDTSLFMRAIAYQQFLYQRRGSPIVIARQSLYFAGLMDDHYIPRTFHALTGMRLTRFLTLSHALYIAFSATKGRRFIDAGWFSYMGPEFGREEIERFLGLLSTSLPDMRLKFAATDAAIRESGKAPRNAAEYFEQSAFVEHPLIRHRQGYECTDVHLLDRCLGRFVYNRLRANGTQPFMSAFGPLFERAVGEAIEYMSLPYRTEKEIAALIQRKEKPSLIDFVVNDGQARIFIDAKGIDIHYRGKVTESMAELATTLETSLIKAISQAASTRQVLDSLELYPADSSNSDDYLVVVTQGEFYVTNGVALENAIGTNAIAAIRHTQSDRDIALERMYFMTIHEFERLTAAVQAGQFGFVEALERARLADGEATTRRMMFEQHLSDWGVHNIAPHYLVAESLRELEHMRQIMLTGTT